MYEYRELFHLRRATTRFYARRVYLKREKMKKDKTTCMIKIERERKVKVFTVC